MTAGPTPTPVHLDRDAGAAERARTVATRPAASVQALGLGTSRLLAAATLEDGQVLVVVPRSGGLATAVRDAPDGDLAAKVTVTSRSTQPLRNPLRARLELAGWLAPVPAAGCAAAGWRRRCAGRRPAPDRRRAWPRSAAG